MTLSVWHFDRQGRPELVGAYPHPVDARRVLRTSVPRGVVVDADGDLIEDRGALSLSERRALVAAAEAWGESRAAANDAVEAWPQHATPDEGEPDALAEVVGVGAATEVPAPASPEAPLPVAWDAPVVETPAEPVADVAVIEVARLRAERDAALGRVAQVEHALAAFAAEREALAASLRERCAQVDALRRELAALHAAAPAKPRKRRVKRAAPAPVNPILSMRAILSARASR